MGCQKNPFLRLFLGAKLHNLINSLRVPQASADAGFGLVLQLRLWETRIHRVLWPELARKFDLWPPKIAVWKSAADLDKSENRATRKGERVPLMCGSNSPQKLFSEYL